MQNRDTEIPSGLVKSRARSAFDPALHTIESRACSIFDSALMSFAGSMSIEKKRQFIFSIFEKSENGYLAKTSPTDLTIRLKQAIAASAPLVDKKEEQSQLAKSAWRACVFCWAALNEKTSGNTESAWFHLVLAAECAGFAEGLLSDSDGKALKDELSEAASKLAKLRHAEHYQLADDALKYWRERIDPNLSAAKAANELLGVVPLSHKKLAELVSAEKKKQS